MKAILSLVLALGLQVSASSSVIHAQTTCRFVMGFEALRNLVGAQKVGTCLEDEHFNLENGNAEQRTAGGLLVWRKVDNFTAFTDGGTTWVNGPNGMQSRPNGERFSWERDPVQSTQARPPAAPVQQQAPATVAPTATATPIATPRPNLTQTLTPRGLPPPDAAMTPELSARCFRLSTEFGLEFASSGAPPGTSQALMALCDATAQEAGTRGVDCFEWGVRQSLAASRRGAMVQGQTMSLIQGCIMSGQR
jgi:hypothetical protein